MIDYDYIDKKQKPTSAVPELNDYHYQMFAFGKVWQKPKKPLTDNQAEILALVRQGLTSEEIGKIRGVRGGTIRTAIGYLRFNGWI